MKLQVITGATFNEIYGQGELIKIIPLNGKEGDNVLTEGLNFRKLEKQTEYYIIGGFKFANMDDLINILWSATNVSFPDDYVHVAVPDDANVVIDTSNFVADCLILGSKRPIKELPCWKDKEFCFKALKKDTGNVKYMPKYDDEFYLKVMADNTVYSIGNMFKFLENPSEEVIMAGLEKGISLLEHVKNPSEQVCIKALKKSPYSLKYLDKKKFTYNVYLEAIKQDPELINTMPEEFKTDEMYVNVVAKDFKYIDYIDNTMVKDPDSFFLKLVKERPSLILEIDMAYLTNEMWFEAVKRDGVLLKHTLNPQVDPTLQTDEMCLAAVTNCGTALQYVKNKTKEICDAAFKQNAWAIQFMPDMNALSDEMCSEAIRRDAALTNVILKYKDNFYSDEVLVEWIKKCPENLFKLKNPSDYLIIEAMKKDGRLIDRVPKERQTEEICLAALGDYTWALRYIQNQTPVICLAAVSKNGTLLEYVKDKTFDICMAAVKTTGYAIRYVPTPDETHSVEDYLKICAEAIKQDPCAFTQVIAYYQTEEMCYEVVKVKGEMLRHVANIHKTPRVCLAAVNNYGYALEFIDAERQTEEICRIAIQKNIYVARFVAKQTQELCELMVYLNADSIKYVKQEFITEEMINYCIEKGPVDAMANIPEQTIEICAKIINIEPKAMARVKNETRELCMHLCLINPEAVNHISSYKIKGECREVLTNLGINIPVTSYYGYNANYRDNYDYYGD